MQLILASGSPARKKLLETLGIPFSIAVSNIDETPLCNESPEKLVYRLAETKAYAVGTQHQNAIIISADQIILSEQQILGKPLTRENAIKQLQQCSGKTVQSLTAMSVLNTKTNHIQTNIATYDVTFRELTLKTIELYLDKEKPYQCAGSLKAEGLGIVLIKEMKGRDPNALIGLPLMLLVDMLGESFFLT